MGYEHVDTALARHCQDTVSLLQVKRHRSTRVCACVSMSTFFVLLRPALVLAPARKDLYSALGHVLLDSVRGEGGAGRLCHQN